MFIDAPFSLLPTTGFWQVFADAPAFSGPPYRDRFPAALPDGRVLELPLRGRGAAPGQPPERAVASLIANQASFAVVEALAVGMADLVRSLAIDAVIGMPTLGLAFAPLVAQRLGHDRFVPLGYSRKYWYDEALSIPVHSLTSPVKEKTVYLDPNQLPLVRGARVLVVDDVISSGFTAAAVVTLLRQVGAEVPALVTAMKQGTGWIERMDELQPAWNGQVLAVMASPHFERRADGWWPVAGTMPEADLPSAA